MAVWINDVLLTKMQLVKFVKTKSGFRQKLARHSAFIAIQEKFSHTAAEKAGKSEAMQQLTPTIPSNTSHNIDFRYGNCPTQGAKGLSVMSSRSYVVSLYSTRQ